VTDDGPVYQALSVHLSRAKLITRFDDRYAVAKFSKSGVYDKVPEGSALIFGDNQLSFEHSVGRVEGSSRAKTSSIRSAVSIEHRLVTDRHRPMVSRPKYRGCLASRGKNSLDYSS